jgi:transcriptional repressor NrdR
VVAFFVKWVIYPSCRINAREPTELRDRFRSEPRFDTHKATQDVCNEHRDDGGERKLQWVEEVENRRRLGRLRMEHDLENTMALLERTPAALDALLRGLPEAWTETNEGEGTWSVSTVLAHLIHCENEDWLPGAREILASSEAEPFAPLDREGHVRYRGNKSLPQLLDNFARARAKSLDELRAMHLTPENLERRGRHPALGPVTLSELLTTWGGARFDAPAPDLTNHGAPGARGGGPMGAFPRSNAVRRTQRSRVRRHLQRVGEAAPRSFSWCACRCRKISLKMKCPYCGFGQDRVVDSRESKEADSIRRRRECERCNRRFTTYERIDEIPYMVVKKDGRRERFDRQKILSGLLRACEKRPVSSSQLEKIVDATETFLVDAPERERTTSEIGELIMEQLKGLDTVAYIRFASVYRDFKDVREFKEELEGLLAIHGKKAGNRE